jgi:photosystem II stability/assembly factor-like uncharacterized protein
MRHRHALPVAAALLLGVATAHAQTAPPPAGTAALTALAWRPIGPANMGGRVTAIEGIPGVRDTFYVAGADGGIFKTTNAGVTFTALFTAQTTYSVGAVAVAPSDHNVLWVGTGEGDPRNSASFGDGVYRSEDAGRTWRHLGLSDSERIKRIVVHPRNPDVALVCALGHAWGPNAERGVFRTTDGGRTWEKVLYRNEDTGCSDLAMDAANPRILYAGLWTFRRRPWHFSDGGGETALYRSMDGGTTWTRLTNGLPQGPMARIGIATSASHPETLYMITETTAEGALFRSDDRGDAWRKVYDTPDINFRPFYYSDIRVDPANPEVVYALSGPLTRSKDGGRTFENIGRGVHGDHQAVWIDPLDPERILDGSDGGYQISYDGAATWKIINNVELSQFYHIAYDLREPYYVCGGLQDNGSWCGPSATLFQEGIRKDDWYTVSGGDGFYAVPAADRPHIIFSNLQGGPIFRTDLRVWTSRTIHPYPNRVGSAGDAMADHKYRFNWDSPIALSPHDPRTVYYGGNVLFRTRDDGQSWEVISPDLSTNDKSKQQSSGGPIYVDNTAAEFHSTILTIAESPVERGVIWAGTDDGNIQVTRDDGATWTDVTKNVRGLPPNSWVSRIEASPHDAGTAYAAIDRHQENDFAPHLYKTTDFGRTWSAITGGLPEKGYTHVVREDTRVRDLLYAGTELGVFVSWDGGRQWSSLRLNLPPVAVRDIQVHPRANDLILGTHGRGAWILDDLRPVQQLAAAARAGAPHLFPARPAVRWVTAGRDANLGSETYAAQNPPYGALVHFYLPASVEGGVRLTIADAQGAKVREIQVREVAPGVNRAVWDLRHEGAQPVPGEREGGGGGGGGGGRFRGGPLAVPGSYTATLTAGAATATTTLEVRPDPRLDLPAADYAAQLTIALELRDLVSQVNRAVGRTESMLAQLAALDRRVGREAPDSVRAAVAAARKRLATFRDGLTRPTPTFGYRQYPRLREELTTLSGAIAGGSARPTDPQMLRAGELRAEVAAMEGALAEAVAAVEALNRMLADRPIITTEGPR